MKQKKGSIIIWPAYLDSKLSRSEGRRIPVNLGAPDVTADILKKAADMRDFDSEIEEGKRYPRQGSNRGGYLILDNSEGHKKKRMLLMLAKGVRRVVAEREAAKKAAEKKSKGKKGKKGRRKKT
ncbi:MAG: signal recognition particle subunit SRP19/SEC65 family protein [Candidatus Thorarchaeota archaeon]|nr:signal recognition particle subunit SRP19/SEC65 family protein [Candidatus Thorarchaeota archaeon]MCK5240087.1 signal recognition particle subunit SRP19/SEC65 family protein [Candidatus Thorarchaeota archaeon]